MKCIHSTRVYNTVLTDGGASGSLKCGFWGSVRLHVCHFCSIMAVLIRLYCQLTENLPSPSFPKNTGLKGLSRRHMSNAFNLAVEWVQKLPLNCLT